MLRSDVEKRVNAYLTETFLDKPEIYRFLSKHERKDLFIDNLCAQIRSSELTLGFGGLGKKRYTYLIREMTKTFCRVALSHAEQAQMTAAQKQDILKTQTPHSDLMEEGQTLIKEI